MPAAAVLAPAALHTCNTASCRGAASHRDTCECSCGGADHGADNRDLFQAARDRVTARVIRRGGDVFLGAAASDDEPF